MQRTSHGQDGGSPLISVLDRPFLVRLLPLVILASCARAGPPTTATVEQNSPAIRGSQLVEAVGFETLGGAFTPVLKACALPCEVTEIFSTAIADQSQIALILLRGNGRLASEVHRLGTFLIKSIPARPAGEPQIAVTLRADAGDLVLQVRDLGGASLSLERESQ